MRKTACATGFVLPRISVMLCAMLCASLPVSAQSYKSQVGATQKGAIARAEHAVVVQVEAAGRARDGAVSARHFAPNLNNTKFKHVSIIVDRAALPSVHSNTVAELFFGEPRSIARGIKKAYVFSAQQWMTRLRYWDLHSNDVHNIFPGRIVNHSWVGSAKNTSFASLLRRLDYSASSHNILHVYGVRNRGSGEALFSSAYNGIAVGGARKNVETAYPRLDALYSSGRYRPEIIAPFGHSSAAVPVVAAAAVRLNAFAAQKNTGKFPIDRAATTHLPVELVKAVLMASASSDFLYSHKDERLLNSFGAMGVSENGLDVRYGAGMLNVKAAEATIAAGAHISVEDQTMIDTGQDQFRPQNAGLTGFHFDAHFGGKNSNSQAQYILRPTKNRSITVSLSWLLALTANSNNQLDGQLYDLDLCLEEVTDSPTIVAESRGVRDSTEHLRATLKAGKVYKLSVSSKTEEKFDWPYALAWYSKP